MVGQPDWEGKRGWFASLMGDMARKGRLVLDWGRPLQSGYRVGTSP